MRVPARFGPVLFSFLLSGVMSLLVAGIATFRTLPAGQDFISAWMGAWFSSWMVAFPAVMLAAPLARKAVDWLTASGTERE
jgi:hypothetical protein